MKRRIVVSLVFVFALAICGGLVWFNFFRDRMIGEFFAKMQPPAQTVSAATVEARTWNPGITAIGTARAENGVELAVEIGGVVKGINIKANEHFGQGEVLVQLDDSVERADLIDIAGAVKLDEANLDRSTALRSRGFDTAGRPRPVGRAVGDCAFPLARVQAVIEQKALKAPFSGVAGIPRIDLGSVPAAGHGRCDLPEPAIDEGRLHCS